MTVTLEHRLSTVDGHMVYAIRVGKVDIQRAPRNALARFERAVQEAMSILDPAAGQDYIDVTCEEETGGPVLLALPSGDG